MGFTLIKSPLFTIRINMNYFNFLIDVLAYAFLVVYVVYDVMHWTKDKTGTLNLTLAFAFISTVITTAVYYFFIR